VEVTSAETACHRCGLPAKLTKFPPAGRILNCELCGEFGIRNENGRDIYTEFKLPYGEDFYEALGRFVVAFSMAEGGVDFLAHAIFHHAGGHILRKRLPKNFEEKIDFLKEGLEQLDALQFRAIELRETFAQFQALVKRRHYYVHGTYGTDVSAPQSFEKNKIKGETLSIDSLEASVSSIRDDAASAMALGLFFMIVSYQLISAKNR
jgi:hypothetical protein